MKKQSSGTKLRMCVIDICSYLILSMTNAFVHIAYYNEVNGVKSLSENNSSFHPTNDLLNLGCYGTNILTD